jgi:hypothetical protein
VTLCTPEVIKNLKECYKSTTNSFYSYASLYITNKNERFTVCVLPVENSKKMVEYLSHFVDLIKD